MTRDSFLLRIDPRVLDALRRWADDELRSVNGQIEFVLRRALRDAGRINQQVQEEPPAAEPPDDAETSRRRS